MVHISRILAGAVIFSPVCLAGVTFLTGVASGPLVGRLYINAGAEYTNMAAVTLNPVCPDPEGRLVYLSYSGDGQNWLPDELLLNSRLYVLTWGDGVKTVYVRFHVPGEPYSEVVSASIILDTAAPGISGIKVKSINAKSAELTFSTTEPYWCSLSYGKGKNLDLEKAEAGDRDGGSGYTSEHLLAMEGLAKGKYYYAIDAFDQAGNCSSSKKAALRAK